MTVMLALAGASCLTATVSAAMLVVWLSPRKSSAATLTPTLASAAMPAGEATAEGATGLPAAPDAPGPAEGGLTDLDLKTRVWSTIVGFYANVRGCTEVSNQRTRVARQPDASRSWEEIWEVSTCAGVASLKIQFTVAPDGRIHYDIAE